MIKRRLFLALLALACVALPQRSPAPVVYRQGEGWSTQGTDEEIQQAKTARAQFEVAQQYEKDGELGKALASYRSVVKRFPRADVASKAQLKAGQLYEQDTNYERAFDAYQKLIEQYPRSDDFLAAVEAQFKIANLFLEGRRVRLLGVPTMPSMERAQKMFESVVKNGPYTKFAPLAQFNIGRVREKKGEREEAVKAYQTVLDKYPNSDIADDALYQIAYVYFKSSQDQNYDQSTVSKARESLEDFIARYPNSEKVAQARDNLKMLGGSQTTGALQVAQFYDKQKKYKAAVIYYNEVIKQQPGSPEATKAKARIEELRQQVGEDALVAGPEKAETGEKARTRRKMQAQVDTAARPDYVGPPPPKVVVEEVAPPKPKMRTSPGDVVPLPPPLEPELPHQ